MDKIHWERLKRIKQIQAKILQDALPENAVPRIATGNPEATDWIQLLSSFNHVKISNKFLFICSIFCLFKGHNVNYWGASNCVYPVRSASLGAFPHSCHRLLTDRSVFSLHLTRIKSPQEPQLTITNTGLISYWCHHFSGILSRHVHLRLPFYFSLSIRAHVDRDWQISREWKPKIRPVYENTVTHT